MKDEHFGITCVEFKASGILTCAHNSAGPAQDILVPFENEPTGFLANDVKEFGEQLTKMFQMEKLTRLGAVHFKYYFAIFFRKRWGAGYP